MTSSSGEDSSRGRSSASEEELIDAGEWEPLAAAQPRVGRKRRVEDTRANLAFCLFALLAGTILILLVLLWCQKLDADEFSQVGGLLVSPLVGLVGSVTGYYYGRTDRN